MSGGALDYFSCNDTIDRIYKVLAFGKGAYSDKVLELMQDTIKKLKEVDIYVHRLEWFLSGDDDEDSMFERLDEDLRKLQQKDRLIPNERTCQSCEFFENNVRKCEESCAAKDCQFYETSEEALEKLELFRY